MTNVIFRTFGCLPDFYLSGIILPALYCRSQGFPLWEGFCAKADWEGFYLSYFLLSLSTYERALRPNGRELLPGRT